MKKVLAVLLLIFSFNLFAGIYKVYFVNGGILVLKEKPDFSKKRVIGETPDGKKIVFLKKLVDFEKTEKANRPKVDKKEKRAIKEEKKKTVTAVTPKSATQKQPLIITAATIGKKANEKKKKTTKKETNPFMSWKNEVSDRDIASDSVPASPTEEIGEKEAENYWRTQFKKINASIKQTEENLKKVKEQLNSLMTEKLNTDDNIVIMRINGEMQKLENKKKKLENNLKQLKKQKEELKEKARKSGALPGWYRDLL